MKRIPTKKLRIKDKMVTNGIKGICVVFLIMFLAMIASLAMQSLPILFNDKVTHNPFSIYTHWRSANLEFGVFVPLFGSLVTTVIAIVFATVLAMGTTMFLLEICPPRWQNSIQIFMETIASIPSVVFGLWGVTFLLPFSNDYIIPFFVAVFKYIPIFNHIFAETEIPYNIFNAALVLGIMIMPFIASITYSATKLVPKIIRESAFALGSTKYEVLSKIIFPSIRGNVIGGIILAMGRAVGETMAVIYLIGNNLNMPDSMFSPFTTATAVIASEFKEAKDLQIQGLLLLALALLGVNLIILLGAKWYLYRAGRPMDKTIKK